MKHCKYETENGRCGLKGCYAYRLRCFTEDLCKCHEPMTNADRIRAMTDEELAKFLYAAEFCDICEEGCENCRYNGDCERRLADWLKQPAEGDA